MELFIAVLRISTYDCDDLPYLSLEPKLHFHNHMLQDNIKFQFKATETKLYGYGK